MEPIAVPIEPNTPEIAEPPAVALWKPAIRLEIAPETLLTIPTMVPTTFVTVPTTVRIGPAETTMAPIHF